MNRLFVSALCVLALLVPTAAYGSPVTDWLAAHGCSATIWNAGIGWPTGHGIFHPEIPCNGQDCTVRYSQTGQRVNGSYAGGEWCTGSSTVGDNTTVGCWLAAVGLAPGYALTATDVQDLGYVDCHGVTACQYIRYNLGGERACTSAPSPPVETCSAPRHCREDCPLPPAPPVLAAVPQDVRDTLDALPQLLAKLGAGTAWRGKASRVKAWLAGVAAYQPKAQSTAKLRLVISECPAP